MPNGDVSFDDLRAVREALRPFTLPLIVQCLTGTAGWATAHARQNGHAPAWDAGTVPAVARCTNEECIGRLWEEGRERWSGSMLWVPCPVQLPTVPSRDDG